LAIRDAVFAIEAETDFPCHPGAAPRTLHSAMPAVRPEPGKGRIIERPTNGGKLTLSGDLLP